MKINYIWLNLICYTIQSVKIKVPLLPITNVWDSGCECWTVKDKNFKKKKVWKLGLRLGLITLLGNPLGNLSSVWWKKMAESRLRLPPDAQVSAGGSLCGGRLVSASTALNPGHLQTSPLLSHQPPWNHTCKEGGGGDSLLSSNADVQPAFHKAPIMADPALNLSALSRTHCQSKQMPLQGWLSVSYLCMGW